MLTAAMASGQSADGRVRVVAVVVYFRTPQQLRVCLDALQGQSLAPDRIVVIDNSSHLGTEQVPSSAASGYEWVRAERNLGYGAACNVGAGMSESDFLLFMNADVVLDERACELLAASASAQRGVAVVGPRVRTVDGAIELSARSFPRASTGLLGRSSLATKLLTLIGRPPTGVSAALGASADVDWVSGACMLVRRTPFEEVGGFDEGYWMYWEDADLCCRLAQGGWRTHLCVEAEAEHQTGSSGRNEATIKAFHESAARYYEQHIAASHRSAMLGRVALRARMAVMLGSRAITHRSSG